MNMLTLLEWWNLIYVVPFALAVLYLGVYTMSGWTFGDADADADVDTDINADSDYDAMAYDPSAPFEMDADVDHDISHDYDADADADTDHDAEADGDGAEHSPVWLAMSFLGIGTVPISLVLMVLLMTFGAIGFAANRIASEYVTEWWMIPFVSLPLATLGSVLLTAGGSRAIQRLMPLNVTTAKRRHELLGTTGEVILPIDATFGMASVRDVDSGDLFQVPCRSEDGTIAKGERVKLIAYNARESIFHVVAIHTIAK